MTGRTRHNLCALASLCWAASCSPPPAAPVERPAASAQQATASAQPAPHRANHPDPRANRGLALADVRIATSGGVVGFRAEVAMTAEQQATGMQHRHWMAPDEAMLFPFPSPRTTAFWMVDTHIPLDMLFIGTDGRIVHIVHQARPLSAELQSSRVPVVAVLELAGGEARRRGIAVGDRVTLAGGPPGLPAELAPR